MRCKEPPFNPIAIIFANESNRRPEATGVQKRVVHLRTLKKRDGVRT